MRCNNFFIKRKANLCSSNIHSAQKIFFFSLPFFEYFSPAFMNIFPIPSSTNAISPQEQLLTRYLFFFVLAVCLLVSGARLSSSDENAIFLLTESIVTRGALDIPANIIGNGSMFEGKFYIWAEIGEALLAIPFYIAGKLITSVLPLSENLRLLALKAIVSTMNAFFGAMLAVVLYRSLRKFSATVRTAMFLSLTLCFGTFMFPYLKTIMRDVQLALLLLGSVYCLYEFRQSLRIRWLVFAGICAAFGVLNKMVFALNIPFLAAYLILIAGKENVSRLKSTFYFSLPFLGTLLIMAAYNYLRFNNFLESGYHGGTSFPTPLFVGVFGLLLSPGKGLFFFAPITILLLWSAKLFFKKFREEALLLYALIIANVLLYAKYVAWGGDGSWGPRYLVAILPLLIVPLGIFLDAATQSVKRIAFLLAVIGVLVQCGGVSIYFGNYLRSIGEYPYTKQFEDAEFMERSHFNPAFSPITGHWAMLVRNAEEHLSGNIPQLIPQEATSTQRIPLAEKDQQQLLHTFDYWFTYGMYAGFSRIVLLSAFALGSVAVSILFFIMYRLMKHVHSDALLSMEGRSV